MRLEKVLNKRYFKVNYRTFCGTVFVFFAGRYQVGIIKKKFPNKTHTKAFVFKGLEDIKFSRYYFGYKNNSHTNVWVVHCFRR